MTHPEKAAVAAYYRGIGYEDICALKGIVGVGKLKVREAFFNLHREMANVHQQQSNGVNSADSAAGPAHLRAVPTHSESLG